LLPFSLEKQSKKYQASDKDTFTHFASAAHNKYNDALLRRSDSPRTLRNFARLQATLGNMKRAEELLLRAIEISPTDSVSLWMYAEYLGSVDRDDEVEEYYLKAIKSNPKFSKAIKSFMDYCFWKYGGQKGKEKLDKLQQELLQAIPLSETKIRLGIEKLLTVYQNSHEHEKKENCAIS